MSNPTEEELKESIKQLSDYKNRLEKEVVTISQKLKMPNSKVNSIVDSHKENKDIQNLYDSIVLEMDIIAILCIKDCIESVKVGTRPVFKQTNGIQWAKPKAPEKERADINDRVAQFLAKKGMEMMEGANEMLDKEAKELNEELNS